MVTEMLGKRSESHQMVENLASPKPTKAATCHYCAADNYPRTMSRKNEHIARDKVPGDDDTLLMRAMRR